MRGMKALLAAVIVMGVMIVVGTAVLISVVVSRATHRPSLASASIADGPPQPGGAAVAALSLDQPPGTRIVSVVRQSDTLLAVSLAGGGPDRLLVWDVAGGRVVARLTMNP